MWNECYRAMHRGDVLRACICAESLPPETTLEDLTNPGGVTLIHSSVAFGYLPVLKLLMKRNFNINCCNDSGYTPLSYACMEGNFEIVKYLLSNGADVNVANYKNEKPIDLVKGPDAQEIIQILLDAGTIMHTK